MVGRSLLRCVRQEINEEKEGKKKTTNNNKNEN